MLLTFALVHDGIGVVVGIVAVRVLRCGVPLAWRHCSRHCIVAWRGRVRVLLMLRTSSAAHVGARCGAGPLHCIGVLRCRASIGLRLLHHLHLVRHLLRRGSVQRSSRIRGHVAVLSRRTLPQCGEVLPNTAIVSTLVAFDVSELPFHFRSQSSVLL